MEYKYFNSDFTVEYGESWKDKAVHTVEFPDRPLDGFTYQHKIDRETMTGEWVRAIPTEIEQWKQADLDNKETLALLYEAQLAQEMNTFEAIAELYETMLLGGM